MLRDLLTPIGKACYCTDGTEPDIIYPQCGCCGARRGEMCRHERLTPADITKTKPKKRKRSKR